MKKVYVLTDFEEIYDVKPLTRDEWVARRTEMNKVNYGNCNWWPMGDKIADLPFHEEDGEDEEQDRDLSSFDSYIEKNGELFFGEDE